MRPRCGGAERRQLLHGVGAGLEVVPVLNKIDLPSADPAKVIKEIEEISASRPRTPCA